MSSKSGDAAARRAAQHRRRRGRHREPLPAASELLATPAASGAKLTAVGVLGTTAALAVPVAAGAATSGPAGPAPAGPPVAAAGPAAPSPVPPLTTTGPPPAIGFFYPMPTVHVVIIGDSFTSGEGSGNYVTKPVEQVLPETGQTYTVNQAYPQHFSDNSPAMQAIRVIQLANPGINIVVDNVAVTGATRGSAASPGSAFSPSQPNTDFALPAQMSKITNADIIINGLSGGDDNNFADLARAIISNDKSVPDAWNAQYAQAFTSGTNLANDTWFLQQIRSANPTATIINVGYPAALPAQAPTWGTFNWLGSPVVSRIGQNGVTYGNLFGQNLNADENAATVTGNVANLGTGAGRSYFVNMWDVFAGHELTTSDLWVNGLATAGPNGQTWWQQAFHPGPAGQVAEAARIAPFLLQGISDVLSDKGVTVNSNLGALTNNPAAQQGFTDAHSQAVDLTQLRSASDLAQLAREAQDGQVTNPDGTPTAWGALIAGLPKSSQDVLKGVVDPFSQDSPKQDGSQPGTPAQPVDGSQPGQPAQDAAPAPPDAAPAQPPAGGGTGNQTAPGIDRSVPSPGSAPATPDGKRSDAGGQSPDAGGQAADAGGQAADAGGQAADAGSSPSFTGAPTPTGFDPSSFPVLAAASPPVSPVVAPAPVSPVVAPAPVSPVVAPAPVSPVVVSSPVAAPIVVASPVAAPTVVASVGGGFSGGSA